MKIPQLTFTRFVAAIIIVMYHFGRNLPPWDMPVLHNVFYTCSILVTYFFALSGFIMVVSSAKYLDTSNVINKSRFWLARFARVYPLYISALVFYIALIMNARTPREKPEAGKILSNLTLTQSWFPEYATSYNYPGWTLTVEVLSYLLFPFMLVWIRKFKSWTIFWIGMASWLVNLIVHIMITKAQVNPHFSMYFPPFHVSTFFLGMCGAIIFLRHYEEFYNRRVLIRWIGLAVVLLTLLIAELQLPLLKYSHNGMFGPVFIFLTFGLSLTRKGKTSSMGIRPLEYLGEISYALYILQAPVWVLVSGLVDRTVKWSAFPTFWFYVLVLMIGSVLAHHLIEVPFQKWIKTRGEKMLGSKRLATA